MTLVLVLIAGVHDPKWPVTPDTALAGASEHRVMSPFDEAALEMALRIRDARPGTVISVRVAGGEAAGKIARAVSALNIFDVATVDLANAWDQRACAQGLARLCEGADVVLVGREFGDFDDGLVPALLAGVLERPFFGRAQTVEIGDTIRLMREVDSAAETLAVTGPLVASVTNDRRTRLRKPLMKNVMLARSAQIAALGTASLADSGVMLEGLRPGSGGRTATDCLLLKGEAQAQASALADLLWESRA